MPSYDAEKFAPPAPVARVTLRDLELVFADRSFRGKFLLLDQEWGILGRNVLNRIPILYDGPRLIWVAQGARKD